MQLSTIPGCKWLNAILTTAEKKDKLKRKTVLAGESLVKEMPKKKQEGLEMVTFFLCGGYQFYLNEGQPYDQLTVL